MHFECAAAALSVILHSSTRCNSIKQTCFFLKLFVSSILLFLARILPLPQSRRAPCFAAATWKYAIAADAGDGDDDVCQGVTDRKMGKRRPESFAINKTFTYFLWVCRLLDGKRNRTWQRLLARSVTLVLNSGRGPVPSERAKTMRSRMKCGH